MAAAQAAAAQSALRAKLEQEARSAAEKEKLSAEEFHKKVQDELNAALTVRESTPLSILVCLSRAYLGKSSFSFL